MHALDCQVKYPACCASPFLPLSPNHILLIIELVKGHINLNRMYDGFLIYQFN